ncbi:MAG TPA: YncE family protein [Candidatus Acidoferrales bacterium]|nr:YncE family protein [Candidatus Acidoferrales bacterium]
MKTITGKNYFAFLAALFVLTLGMPVRAAEPIELVAKYPMPADVKGRFDHLSVDVRGNRLFLAAETAHEVLVFNLHTGKFIRAITGIGIPHAIFVREDLNRIFITDGGAGEVKMYNGRTYRLLGAAKLRVDSDSIGYDPATHFLYVVNGGGDAHETFSMLSVINTNTGRKVADIQIDGDTLEAMAIAKGSAKIYQNNPSKSEVDVINRETRRLLARWPVTMGKRNVAMAFDEASHRLFVACRSGVIVVFDSETGKELQTLPISTGVDDLIFDAQSKRIYASCGTAPGALFVYHEDDADHYSLLDKVSSAPGGKNEVLAPSLGRLFITVPPQGTAPGEVYVYAVQ